MVKRRSKSRSRSLGSPSSEHSENFKRHSDSALAKLEATRDALARGQCARANSALAKAAYQVGASARENAGVKADRAGYDPLVRILEEDLASAVDAVNARCMRPEPKRNPVSRAAEALRRKFSR